MFSEQVKMLLNILKESVAPKRCIGCGTRHTFLCNNCAATIYTPIGHCLFCKKHSGIGVCRKCAQKTHLHDIFWVTRYGNPVTRALIRAFKYRGAHDISANIAHLLFPHALSLPKNTVYIPIPLHKKRLRFRGFNQSTEIASQLSLRTGHNYVENILLRNIYTPPFAKHVKREDRKKFIKDAFAVHGEVPSRIILVDDVATSGATLREAARVLHKNGAEYISAIVFAHD